MMSSSNEGNGSQRLPASKRPVSPPQQQSIEDLMEPPAWLKSLRDAMTSSIDAADLKAVMAKQVEKAKEGDTKAASFVMDQAHRMLQSEAKRAVTITQNNYYDTPRPDEPVRPGDGKDAELKKFTARARAGLPITGNGKDRRFQPVTDEEEKSLHRDDASD